MWEVNLKQVCFRFVWLFIFADSFYQMFGFKFLQQERSWKVVSKVHTHYFRVVLLLSLPRYCLKQQRKKSDLDLVLQRKPFAFELFFCLANAGFFTFSSKTRSIVSTSNLYISIYWNVQLALLCVLTLKWRTLHLTHQKLSQMHDFLWRTYLDPSVSTLSALWFRDETTEHCISLLSHYVF